MMTPSEMAAFLGLAASVDNRIVTEETVTAWMDAIGDLDPRDCREALAAHRRESSEYLQPAHVATLVKRIRQARADEHRRELARGRNTDAKFAPKPHNWDAMSKAWKDPIAFAREVEIYDQQLIDAGLAPTPLADGTTPDWVGSPMRGQGRDYALPTGDR
jgi:hypothetical protein